MQAQNSQQGDKHDPSINSSHNTSYQNSEMHSFMQDLVKTRIVSEGSELYKSVERSIHSIAEIVSKTVNYEKSVKALTNSNILHQLSESYHLESHPNELTQGHTQPYKKEESYLSSLSKEEDEKQRHHVLSNQHVQLMEQLGEQLERTKSMEEDNEGLRRRVEEDEGRKLENMSAHQLAKATKHYHEKMKEYEGKYKRLKERNHNISWIVNGHGHPNSEQEEKM